MGSDSIISCTEGGEIEVEVAPSPSSPNTSPKTGRIKVELLSARVRREVGMSKRARKPAPKTRVFGPQVKMFLPKTHQKDKILAKKEEALSSYAESMAMF